MKRGFALDQDEIVRAIARGVVEERLPPGEWLCSVELILDGPARRFRACSVIAGRGTAQDRQVDQVHINTRRKVDDLQARVAELEDLRARVRTELKAIGSMLRGAPKRRPKHTSSA